MVARRTRKRRESEQQTELPAVNSAVELASEAWSERVRSRVEDTAGQSVMVSRPLLAGSEPVRARTGDQLRMHWTTPEALYEVAAEVSAISGGEVPTWTLTPHGPVSRQQRRESFRLDVRLAAQLGTATQAAGLAQVHDLSEGGLRCTPPSETELEEGSMVWVELGLPDGEVRLDAEVVRVSGSGEVGLRFEGTTEQQAEQIRAFLFSEQLARRARLAT